MATPNDQVVTTSTRLWSEEVALAEAQEGLPPKDVAYQFNNGRVFYNPDPPTS